MTTTEAALRDLVALANRYSDTMGLTREGAIRRIGVLVDAILDAQPSPASSTAGEVMLTCLCGTVNKRTLPYDMSKPDSCDHCDCANFGHYSTVSLSPSSGEPASVAGEEDVRHLAAILEEWDMKDPPNEFTGHAYEDIARDALTRLALSKPTPVEAGLRERQQAFIAGVADWWNYPGGRDAIIREAKALAALSETQPPRETSTQEKQNG